MAATKKNITNAPAAEIVAAAAEPAAIVAEPVAAAAEPALVEGGAATGGGEELSARINAAIEKTQLLVNTAKELLTFFKSVQKDVAKLQKLQNKRHKKPSSAAAGGAAAGGVARSPSGFAKPTSVSKELCDFLGVSADRKLARTEVTRLLNKYIKDNNLQDPVDRRTIRPDGKLQKLLDIDGDMQLKYFNMQRYIKHHFIKDEAAVPATATATA